MTVKNLKDFATKKGIELAPQDAVAGKATKKIRKKYSYTTEQIKDNFDSLLRETESLVYKVYLEEEKKYGKKVFNAFLKELREKGSLKTLDDTGEVLGRHFHALDKFFLSLAQSRKSRAGKSFEHIHNALFKTLDYPFDEQVVINGKPDFLMPSEAHYKTNPMDCIIFTAKRTLRERWRQIVTEGTRGLGFYLATIDEKVSANQLREMKDHRIYLVCPEDIIKENPVYQEHVNVLSFRKFFRDHLDPRMKSWKRNKII